MAFCGSGPACLLSWPGMMNAGWLGSMRSEILLQMKFSVFKAVPPNRLPFYQGSLHHITNSLFSYFFLFQNAVLHKMLKLGFEKIKPFFWECSFHWFQYFVSLVLVICLSWYRHLKLSHEFLTFISFNIWRWKSKSIRSSHLLLGIL